MFSHVTKQFLVIFFFIFLYSSIEQSQEDTKRTIPSNRSGNSKENQSP